MSTLGITNGCTDMLFQAPLYPVYAYNNTYNLQTIPTSVFKEAADNFTKPGGCRELILQCRALAAQGDPEYGGANATVNEACVGATGFCAAFVQGAYTDVSGVSGPYRLLLFFAALRRGS
jgi:hypothetical protein